MQEKERWLSGAKTKREAKLAPGKLKGRSFRWVQGLLVACLIIVGSPALADSLDFDPAPLERIALQEEARLSARVGIAVMDTQSGTVWQHRGNERFPLYSTFKAFLCAALLDAGDKGELEPSSTVVIRGRDLVSYSPVTEKQVGAPGLSLTNLCEATATTSDNTAANLVMKALGGPASVTGFLRENGDETTRLDRWEPEMNSAVPGDERDTTTPLAAAKSLQKFVLEDVLADESRNQLTEWLIGNQVGQATLRAGLPDGWAIADKTGAGGFGSRSNIAVVWPAGREPVVIAVYVTQTTAPFAERNRAIANIGRALAESLKGGD